MLLLNGCSAKLSARQPCLEPRLAASSTSPSGDSICFNIFGRRKLFDGKTRLLEGTAQFKEKAKDGFYLPTVGDAFLLQVENLRKRKTENAETRAVVWRREGGKKAGQEK